MTKEEAIKLLDDITSYCDFTDEYGDMIDSTPYYEALDMAIKALEQQPSDDCVSRKETIEWLKKVTVTDGITFKTGFEQILHDIEQMPSVTPKQETGEWIPLNYKDEMWGYVYKCSNCGATEYKDNFCPNCGAKMKSEEV